jgi:hypothetical protein
MLVNHYEYLRRACLEACTPLPGALGLTVLLRHGMLAWSGLCAATLSDARAPAIPLDRARVPAPVHADIVQVMVTMATGLWSARAASEVQA